MPVNKLFANHFNALEQSLIDDLVVESIRQYGIDMLYLPRTNYEMDPVFREPEYTDFDAAYTIEMYIKSLSGYSGDGKMFTAFDLEIKDEMTFTVALTSFKKEVTKQDGTIIRPREGDVLYFPIAQKCFQISYVNQTPVFFQMGSIQFYDIQCQLFVYNNEKFNTGIPIIDDTYNALSTDMSEYQVEDHEETDILDDLGIGLAKAEYSLENINTTAQNDALQTINDEIEVKDETDPFNWKN